MIPGGSINREGGNSERIPDLTDGINVSREFPQLISVLKNDLFINEHLIQFLEPIQTNSDSAVMFLFFESFPIFVL